MPTLSIDFTDVQVARIKATLGVSTAAEAETKIKEWIASQVKAKARTDGVEEAVAIAETELDGEGWND